MYVCMYVFGSGKQKYGDTKEISIYLNVNHIVRTWMDALMDLNNVCVFYSAFAG